MGAPVVDSVVEEEVDLVVEEVEDLVVEEVVTEVAVVDLEVEEVVDVVAVATSISKLFQLIRRSLTERHKVLPLKSWSLSLFFECPDNVCVSQLAHPILCLPASAPHCPRNYC